MKATYKDETYVLIREENNPCIMGISKERIRVNITRLIKKLEGARKNEQITRNDENVCRK